MTVTGSAAVTRGGWLGLRRLVGPTLLALGCASLAVFNPVLGVEAAIALALGAMVAATPLSISVPLLLALAPLRLHVQLPGTPYEVSATTGLTLALAAAVALGQVLQGSIRLTRFEWGMVALWAWLALTLVWSVNRGSTLRGIYNWSYLFAMTYLTAQALLAAEDRPVVLRRLICALLALVAFWSAVGFLQMAAGLEAVSAALSSPLAAVVYSPSELRIKLGALGANWVRGASIQPFGPFDNSIVFGIFTAVGASVAVACIVGRIRFAPRWLIVTTLVLAVAADLATLKATGWLAAVAGAVVVFISLGGSIRRVLQWGAGLLVVTVVFVAIFRDAIVARLADLASRELATTGSVEAISRIAMWVHYSGVAAHRPLTGYGLNTATNFGPVRFTAATGTGASISYRLPAESGYINTVVEAGLPGLIGLVLMLGGAFVFAVRTARRHPDDPLAQAAGVMSAGLAAILVGNAAVTGFSEEVTSLLVGVMLGVIVTARRARPPSLVR